MRQRMAILVALVFAATTMLVASGPGDAASSWSIRASAYSQTIRAASTEGTSVNADADTRRNPERMQMVLRWESPSGGANRVTYYWYTTCWNQARVRNSARNRVISTNVWDRSVVLQDCETYREAMNTYDRNHCEVHVGASVDSTPPGKLVVRIRDRN